MFEFSDALRTLKRKDLFIVYSLSLLYFTGFKEAIITNNGTDCMLEIPEKKTKKARNYCQIWDSICFHDIFSLLQSLACNKLLVSGQHGTKSMYIALEENKIHLYEANESQQAEDIR